MVDVVTFGLAGSQGGKIQKDTCNEVHTRLQVTTYYQSAMGCTPLQTVPPGLCGVRDGRVHPTWPVRIRGVPLRPWLCEGPPVEPLLIVLPPVYRHRLAALRGRGSLLGGRDLVLVLLLVLVRQQAALQLLHVPVVVVVMMRVVPVVLLRAQHTGSLITLHIPSVRSHPQE